MRIAKDSTYPIVVLPRYKRQRLAYEKLKSAIGNKLIMPVNPLHGLTLIKHAVAVISFGATMAREAALLGTVGICAFSQKLYTDTYLDDKYNYMHIQNIDDIVNVLKSIAPADAKRCVPRFKMDDWSYRILQLLQTTD
jgi:predicted glycosyltransferase